MADYERSRAQRPKSRKEPAASRGEPAQSKKERLEITKDEFEPVQEQMIDMLYYMKLGRALEERLELLYKQGAIPSAIYLGRGQEASEVGTSYALDPGDVIAPTHRDVISQLPRGMSVRLILAQHFGKATSPTRGRGEATYLGDLSKGIITTVSMLPDGYPLSAGAAMAFKYRGEKRVALAYCGEGATAHADFHEAVNFAAVLVLPVIFVVINNQFAYSTPVYKEMRVTDIAQRAECYGIPGIAVDGNDVVEVWKATKAAAARARVGEGATLIEARTMRMRGHAGHDPAKYVPKEMMDEWARRDPIDRLTSRMRELGYVDDAALAEVDARVADEVAEGLKFAQESPLPEPKEVATGVYAA